jgi:hypothetical protein
MQKPQKPETQNQRYVPQKGIQGGRERGNSKL